MMEFAVFNTSSPKHGLHLGQFDHLSDDDKVALRGLIARMAEKSFRRGFQQGWDSAKRGDSVCDLVDWRFSTDLDVSVSPHDSYHSTSEHRLFVECDLTDVGIPRPEERCVTPEMIATHLAPLFARHRKKKGIRKATRFFVLRRDGFRCVYCGATSQQSQLHVDHVFPRSLGGTDDPKNLVAACAACNIGKSNKHADMAMEAKDGQ